MSRVAYIGASSPIAFDYIKFHARQSKYPNPILEAPLGLFIMYDELLFLDPVVCPYNMKGLEYVKFVTDEEDLSKYIDILKKAKVDQPRKQYPWKDWSKIVKTIAPFARADNHSVIGFHKAWRVPDSTSVENVVLDQTIALVRQAEPITNTLTDDWLSSNSRSVIEGLSLIHI